MHGIWRLWVRPSRWAFSFMHVYVTRGSSWEDLLPFICKSPSVISLTSYGRLELIKTLVWWERSFFTLKSLPSSIGQSIRLKCTESEGCEFDPHGGLFYFMNVYVTWDSPWEDMLPSICNSPLVISLTSYNRLELIQNTCVVWEKLFYFAEPA